jgi:hypothetical protein
VVERGPASCFGTGVLNPDWCVVGLGRTIEIAVNCCRDYGSLVSCCSGCFANVVNPLHNVDDSGVGNIGWHMDPVAQCIGLVERIHGVHNCSYRGSHLAAGHCTIVVHSCWDDRVVAVGVVADTDLGWCLGGTVLGYCLEDTTRNHYFHLEDMMGRGSLDMLEEEKDMAVNRILDCLEGTSSVVVGGGAAGVDNQMDMNLEEVGDVRKDGTPGIGIGAGVDIQAGPWES